MTQTAQKNRRTEQALSGLAQHNEKTAVAKELSPVQKAKQNIATLLDSSKHAIAQALPRHMNPERLLRVALTAANTTPALLNCHPPTLVGAVIQAAQLGLEPNTPLGHAYLVPFKNRQKQRQDVQLVIGYKGLIDLALRGGTVTKIAAFAVREGDDFEFEYGLNEKLRHIPSFDDDAPITHFYAYAFMKGGGHAFVVLSVERVVRTMREETQSKGAYGPWKDNFEEMGCKTAVRRLSKYLPLSIEMAKAIDIDGKGDAGLDQGFEGIITGEWSEVHPGPADEPQASQEDGGNHPPEFDQR